MGHDAKLTGRLLQYDYSAVPTVLLLACLAVVLAALLRRRRVVWALAGVSLAGAVGLTVTPFGGWHELGFESGALRSVISNLTPHRSALLGWLDNRDGPPNVLLYLPAGFFLAWALRRPVAVAVGLTLMSVAIECWQATLTTRVGSFDDVVANGLGAVLGAGVAAVVLFATRQRRAPSGTSTGTGADGVTRTFSSSTP